MYIYIYTPTLQRYLNYIVICIYIYIDSNNAHTPTLLLVAEIVPYILILQLQGGVWHSRCTAWPQMRSVVTASLWMPNTNASAKWMANRTCQEK